MYHAAVLTVSDRVSRGERPDEGSPLVAELLKNALYFRKNLNSFSLNFL